jgi:hypothetical protein
MTVWNLRIESLLPRRNRQLIWLSALLLSVFSINLNARDKKKITYDSAAMELRQPTQDVKEDIGSDENWLYDRDSSSTKSEPSFLERFWKNLTEDLFSMDVDAPDGGDVQVWGVVLKVLIILIFAGLIVWIIIRATKSGTSKLFKSKNKKDEEVTDATIEDVDIHAISYDTAIEDAVRQQDYRIAVRLWFLRTLKTLSDRELIQWKSEKTNSDYYYELSGSSLQEQFGQLSFVYDYIWYGEFPVNEDSYQKASADFRAFLSKIVNTKAA